MFEAGRAEALAWILDGARQDPGFREWLKSEIQEIEKAQPAMAG